MSLTLYKHRIVLGWESWMISHAPSPTNELKTLYGGDKLLTLRHNSKFSVLRYPRRVVDYWSLWSSPNVDARSRGWERCAFRGHRRDVQRLIRYTIFKSGFMRTSLVLESHSKDAHSFCVYKGPIRMWNMAQKKRACVSSDSGSISTELVQKIKTRFAGRYDEGEFAFRRVF